MKAPKTLFNHGTIPGQKTLTWGGSVDYLIRHFSWKVSGMDYFPDKMKGIDEPYHFEQLKGKNIKVMWEGTHVHADDEIIKLEKNEKIEIELREGLLKFLVPN